MANNLGNKAIMAANLTEYMKKKGIDRQTLSEAIGVPYTTVTDWIKAKTYPRIDKIELMAKYFGITKADLIEDRSSFDVSKIKNLHSPGARKVPILGEICAGNGVIAEQSYKGYFYLDETIKCDFILDVSGDSMIDAEIYDGDKVMILVTYDYKGKICAVVLKDTSEAVLKRVDTASGKLVLSSYNKEYQPIVCEEQEVYIVGECVGVYHEMKQ